MSQFKPLMLVIARESRKLSQTALAKEAGISQSAVSQMEAGIIAPTDEVARRIAEALGYRPSLLFSPHRFQQLPITFFRKQARVGARDVAAIRARINLFSLRIEALLRSYHVQDPKLVLSDLVAEGLSPEEAAQRLRVYWNLPPGPIPDLTRVVEEAGILVVPTDFGTSAVDGLSLFEPNGPLPPIVFLNHGVPGDRWRMTLAHELGHIALHHHLRIPPPSDVLEDEAFAFAAELLMPRREIGGYLTRLSMARLVGLKKQWRVSMGAIVIRARHMGYLSNSRERQFWIHLGRGGRMSEPVEIAPERSALLKRVVDYHLKELGYSARDLSATLHMNLDEFRAEFGLTPAPLRLA